MGKKNESGPIKKMAEQPHNDSLMLVFHPRFTEIMKDQPLPSESDGVERKTIPEWVVVTKPFFLSSEEWRLGLDTLLKEVVEDGKATHMRTVLECRLKYSLETFAHVFFHQTPITQVQFELLCQNKNLGQNKHPDKTPFLCPFANCSFDKR